MKQLTAKQRNRLAIEQQIIYIRLLENALKYEFKNSSWLFGEAVDSGHLVRAKEQLRELDRLRGIYESEAYGKKKLPYLPSAGSTIEKVKAHYDDKDGEFLFFEVKSSTSGKFITEHALTKSHIKSKIKAKNMATKKKAAKPAKKAAPKKGAKKTATKKVEGDSIKSRVHKLVGQGKTNAQIFEALDKEGIVYSILSVRWYASKARALA